MFRHIKQIHFVGIGGAGMSGIAEILVCSDYRVTGSDIKKTPVTERLRSIGVDIRYEHSEDNIKGADVLVYSSAVRDSNPEIKVARRLSIPVIPRAEMLSELMRMKQGIAIAGTHGKTTTTSIIAKILTLAGYDPTVVVGGRVKSIGTGGKLGKGDYLVCEADESDRSFLSLSPVISVITSIDADHLDNYESIDEIRNSFLKFANNVPFYGCTILSYDDANVRRIIREISRRTITYGLLEGSCVLGYEIEFGLPSKFYIRADGDQLGQFSLLLPGIHYLTDAIGAVAVGIELEIPKGILRDGIESFEGVERRFEFLRCEDISIVDDYAHHPKEIEETLKAARTIHKGRIIAVFQPHLYSRTEKLLPGFIKSLELADQVIVTEIYPAREEPIPGIGGDLIVEGMKSGNPIFIKEKDEIPIRVKQLIKKGDMVLTLGAGNIRDIAEELNRIL